MANLVLKPLHNRTYACEAFRIDDPDLDGVFMLVRGRVTDIKPEGMSIDDGDPMTIHDMVVELTVDTATFEIVGVEVTMETHPYTTCVDVLVDYQSLVGTSISRGYTNLVRKTFGGPNGCSHVGALLVAMGPVAIQASWGLRNAELTAAEQLDDGETDDAERERRLRLNTNTCHVWKEGGEHLQAVLESTEPPQPPDMTNRLHAVASRQR